MWSLSNLFTSALLTLTAFTSATKTHNPISDHSIIIAHRSIASSRSFDATRAALESAIPAVNMTFKGLLDADKPAAALAALQSLPALNNFILPARDFGQLVEIYGIQGKKAIQYEIGNPYTASKVARYDLGVALYAPIRVALLEDPKGVVKFVFDRPTSTFGQFKDKIIDITAAALDNELTQLFLFAGGWPSEWPLPALP